MAVETHIHAGSGTWRKLDEFHIHAGSGTWRNLDEAWVHAGSGTWRKIFETASCATGACNTGTSTWSDQYSTSCTTCAANTCSYCMRADWSTCDDACHEIDGEYSLSGGSWLASLSCQNKTCTNASACNCAITGGYDFNCELTRFGSCIADTSSIQGRVHIMQKGTSTVECTLTGSVATGACIA